MARVLIVLASLAACQRTIAPAPPAPPAPAAATAPAPRDAYVSDLTGIAYGDAFASATADGAPSTQTRSSTGDQATNAAASRDGDELKRSCGRDGVQSHAQATAAFQPLSAADVRQFGFALSTTTYARGGSWRSRYVLCRSAHGTVAAADARATGRIDLTFDAHGSATEQLVLRVAGASPATAHLEVRDGEGRLLPLGPVPGDAAMAATLASPGVYTVRASLASHAEAAGAGNGGAQRATTFSVSVQSRRDALALGYGRGPTNALTLPLPVFVSADAITAALDSALFTDQHRLYPCAKVDCGTTRLRDVYLESPRVRTTGASVVVDMHLSGSYALAFHFGRDVSGTIRAMAVPVVERDTLRFEAPSIDLVTRSLLVKWRAASFERRFLDRIRSVRVDLTPALQAAVAKAQEQLSGTWGGACLLVTPTAAHLRSVQVVTTAPQGIVATFDIALAEGSGGTCAARRTLR